MANKQMTYRELYNKFCIWSPGHAKMVSDYRPWGKSSIVVWLNNGQAYKAKYIDDNHFVMQMVSDDDINKKFGLK